MQASQLLYAQFETTQAIEWLNDIFDQKYSHYEKYINEITTENKVNVNATAQLRHAFNLIDFALDFIPLVRERQNYKNQKEEDYYKQKQQAIDESICSLIGNVLSRLHLLGVGQKDMILLRIEATKFCLKVLIRLSKKRVIQIPTHFINQFLQNSIIELSNPVCTCSQCLFVVLSSISMVEICNV